MPPAALAQFLPQWQHIGKGHGLRGIDGLVRAIEQLQGASVPASALEKLVLPSRVANYTPAMLDELTAAGEVVWAGAGSLPGKDGWVSLYMADAAPLLLPPSDRGRGACAEDVRRPVVRRRLLPAPRRVGADRRPGPPVHLGPEQGLRAQIPLPRHRTGAGGPAAGLVRHLPAHLRRSPRDLPRVEEALGFTPEERATAEDQDWLDYGEGEERVLDGPLRMWRLATAQGLGLCGVSVTVS